MSQSWCKVITQTDACNLVPPPNNCFKSIGYIPVVGVPTSTPTQPLFIPTSGALIYEGYLVGMDEFGSDFLPGQNILPDYFVDLTNYRSWIASASASLKSLSVAQENNETDMKSDVNYSFFPNPSAGKYNLQANNNASFSVSVYDVAGREVETQLNIVGTSTIDITDQPAGVYMAVIRDSNGSTVTKKLVKYEQQ
jgi:hypothetical protein